MRFWNSKHLKAKVTCAKCGLGFKVHLIELLPAGHSGIRLHCPNCFFYNSVNQSGLWISFMVAFPLVLISFMFLYSMKLPSWAVVAVTTILFTAISALVMKYYIETTTDPFELPQKKFKKKDGSKNKR